MPITPEDRARQNIDKLLIDAGWIVQDKRAEAQAASALNHSNICTIHDLGEENGLAFIAIEYLRLSPHHRFVIALCSPRALPETGLRTYPPEKVR